jgi:hypothetical protein
MAIDDDRQALAQRYLIQALRLAQESGDTTLGAHVLAGMSWHGCSAILRKPCSWR